MKWRKLSDGPPPKPGSYIIHAPSADPDLPLICVAWWEDGSEYPRGWSLMSETFIPAITHWMPLPKPPKEEAQ